MVSGRAVAFGLAAAGVVVIGLFVLAGNSPRADYNTMRAFAVSRLSDEDLRRFDAQARAEYAAEYAAALEQHRASLRQQSADRARCDDVAFRTRSPAACTMSFGEMMPFDPIISSVAMRIEMQIMGVCGLGPFTVREARRLGCLP
ncbi:hypothetical protein [Roseomonas sp. CECT 9278]|uniref:hypothetical protein n=1 Tax=Roseomonas sp. CECT 9278 TaxID=2845823 RepID=UPI001E32A096|nr:hypothetical protein [Roseomonas sp. CECT 9278]